MYYVAANIPNIKKKYSSSIFIPLIVIKQNANKCFFAETEFGALPGMVTSNTHYSWLYKVQEYQSFNEQLEDVCYKT